MSKIVIALGGNAILKKGEKPTIKTQEKNVRRALKSLLPLIRKNQVVITHGNGPQVGYLLMQQKMPLDALGAETGGQIGYLIQQNLHNLLKKRECVTLITQVLVDSRDGAFRRPEKFVGPFYRNKGSRFTMKKDPRGGWRRVVASPKPIRIIEANAINSLLKNGNVVIAVGGGGVPVVERSGKLDGVEAVIDKDLASACLAKSIKADTLVMVTDIDGAYLNFGKHDEKLIQKANLLEIKRYYAAGHFPAGSMGPKIQAAINFLEGKGKKAVITDIKNIEEALKGKAGTILRR